MDETNAANGKTCIGNSNMDSPKQVNLLFGPPSDPADDELMLETFFSSPGIHVICGGTSAQIAARYLGKPLEPSIEYADPAIPPIAHIDGVALVTEGIITLTRVLEYAKAYIESGCITKLWLSRKDGASLVASFLFGETHRINAFVGLAVNPASDPNVLSGEYHPKKDLMNKLVKCLTSSGKTIKVNYY